MTMKNRETADWLAIKDGRIAAIGGGNQYEPMAEQAGLILDAKGGPYCLVSSTATFT